MAVRPAVAIAAAGLFRRYPYRGKTLIWNRLESWVAPGRFEVRQAGGGRMLIDSRLFWQRQMLAACFERAGAWVAPRLLGRGDVVIDAGANCGYYSCLAAGRVGPGGRVIAFEPDPRLHVQLDRQRELNPGIITVEPVAVSDHAGSATFHINPADDPEGLTVGHGSLEPQQGWKTMQVPTVALDDYLSAHGIRQVRLLKLDLEGHESRALAGAAQSLASGVIENLLVEVNDRETAATLLSLPWELVVLVRRRWRAPDPATLGAQQDDVLCLRGEGARRFRALSLKWLV